MRNLRRSRRPSRRDFKWTKVQDMEIIGSVSQVASGEKKIGVECITDMSRIGMWTGSIGVCLLEDFTA